MGSSFDGFVIVDLLSSVFAQEKRLKAAAIGGGQRVAQA
jgi:hypothetical protein